MTAPRSPLSRQALQQTPVAPTEYIGLILRLIAGSVLFYAGFMKAVGPSAEFAAVIEAYKILPSFLITPLAMGLPWMEMWLGLFLFFGYGLRPSAGAASVLFTIFLSVLISVHARGIVLASCGCFGADALPPRVSLLLDAILLIGSLWLVFKTSSAPWLSLDRWIRKSPPSHR